MCKKEEKEKEKPTPVARENIRVQRRGGGLLAQIAGERDATAAGQQVGNEGASPGPAGDDELRAGALRRVL